MNMIFDRLCVFVLFCSLIGVVQLQVFFTIYFWLVSFFVSLLLLWLVFFLFISLSRMVNDLRT